MTNDRKAHRTRRFGYELEVMSYEFGAWVWVCFTAEAQRAQGYAENSKIISAKPSVPRAPAVNMPTPTHPCTKLNGSGHSDRSELTGFTVAAFIDSKLTVSHAIIRDDKNAIKKIVQ